MVPPGTLPGSLTERLLRQNAELTGFVSRLSEEKNNLRNAVMKLQGELRRYQQRQASGDYVCLCAGIKACRWARKHHSLSSLVVTSLVMTKLCLGFPLQGERVGVVIVLSVPLDFKLYDFLQLLFECSSLSHVLLFFELYLITLMSSKLMQIASGS